MTDPVGEVPFLLNIPRFSARPLCAEVDPEIFFPDKGGSIKAAKDVCSKCDARFECAEYALDNKERFGIWGNLSERERERLQKQREKQLTTVEKRRLKVAEWLGKGWTPAAVAQLLGVPAHVVRHDRDVLAREAS